MDDLTAALAWWLTIQVLGFAALPLAFRLFRWLPDRGYSLSKAMGVLLTSYIYWMLNILGLVHNSAGGVLFAGVTVAILSFWAYHRKQYDVIDFESLADWGRRQVNLILVTELLFGLTFAVWLFVRAYNPMIIGTEKPMDLAFLNAIGRSGSFPPNDPWLSGFAISYYYFGYVTVATLAKITGVAGSVSFSLVLGWHFAGTLRVSFCLVFNLVASGRKTDSKLARPVGFGLLGSLMVGIMGNLEGFLEVLHVNAILPTRFWQWLDIKEINTAPPAYPSWPPRSTWWWWRASRVINDRDILGNSMEVIDEFPFFSFLLGDMHAHVMTLPFIFLALALALNWWLKPWERTEGMHLKEWMVDFVRQADPFDLAIYAICLGSLICLNTWDYPVHLFVTVGTLGLVLLRQGTPVDGSFVLRLFLVGGGLVITGLVAFLPFLVGFRSQAGGLLPNIINPSRLSQFGIMFGPFLFVLALWIIDLVRRLRVSPKTFLGVSGGLLLSLVLLSSLFAVVAVSSPIAQGWVQQTVEQTGGVGPALQRILEIRVNNSWTVLFLLVLVGSIASLWTADPADQKDSDRWSKVTPFVLLLMLTAVLLTLTPEFVYLKDNFGTRMNTIFKFYYQAWVLFAITSAFALHATLKRTGAVRWVSGIGAALLILAGLFYPVLSISTRTNSFRGDPTLDGMAYMATSHPADYAAISWLQENVSGAPVILEAVGGQYSWGGRISAHTGLPTVLGWAGHEHQWRGSTPEPAVREEDIKRIYTSPFWSETQILLDKYGIEYIIVGPLEWSTYGQVSLSLFDRALETVFEADGVKIYRWNSLTS
jgi:YYY domain-containing protein